MKENQVRHSKNIKIFTGRYHGTYFERGIPKTEIVEINKRKMLKSPNDGKK